MAERGRPNGADPRVLRTRQLIRDAFVDLLEETELEKITVNRITERATINRVTFYLHYRDMPDMLDKMADDIFADMQAALRETERESYAVMVRLLEHIEGNAKLFKLLLATKRVPVFTERFLHATVGMISDKIEQRFAEAAASGEDTVPPDIGAWYVTSALVGTIVSWLRHDMPYRPQYLARQLLRLAPRP